MISVALIGGDGAGKSTVAAWLQANSARPLRVLYMGVSGESTNIALPWTQFVQRSRSHNSPGALAKRPGFVRGALGLLNRLAEEWYRQFVSWRLRRCGAIVVYDRHFLFDFEYEPGVSRNWRDLVHRWLLARFYPSPDLVLFLDAPAEVLYARKREFDLAWLDARRRAFLRAGERTRNFVVIDATRPLDTVCQQVAAHIEHTYAAALARKRFPRQAPAAREVSSR